MTYREAIDYLGRSRFFGMKPGLERMHRIAERLGRPQDGLRFIHIAGTNGKGSTAAFCESILRAAGLRVGLYTSPHLVTVRERVQINRVPISQDDFAAGIEAVRAAGEGEETTFFEITTALALWYFAREKVDWVVWETGLGGRLDATNIVMPQVCIITNIGLEHQKYLGNTLAEIAAEKAGIIKPGVPVISGVADGGTAAIFEHQAKLKKSEFVSVVGEIGEEYSRFWNGRQQAQIGCRVFRIGLLGKHQVSNAACAVAAIEHLNSSRHYYQELIKEDPDPPGGWTVFNSVWDGLERTQWPGRFDILSEQPLLVLDGAHNPSGMKALVETWREFLASKFGWSAAECEGRARLVFASVEDKNIAEMAALLRPLAKEVLLVKLANERGADPKNLLPFFSGLPCRCHDSVAEAAETIEAAPPESITLVTGSLFLIGEMLARRQGVAEEYELNERLEKPSQPR